MSNSIFVFICSFLELITIFYIIKILNGSEKLNRAVLIIFCIIGATLISILDYYQISYQMIIHMVYYTIFMVLIIKLKIYIALTDVLIANGIFFVWQLFISFLVDFILKIPVQSFRVMLVLVMISVAIVITIYRSVKLDRYIEKYYRKNRVVILWGTLNLIILACFTANSWEKNIEFIWRHMYILLVLIIIYIVCNIVTAIIWIRMKVVQEKNENIISYTEYLKNIVDIYNRREHEYKNQINAIIGLAENNTKENVANKIIRYCQVILRSESEKNKFSVISDNTMIAAFILRTEKLAKSLGINFEYFMNAPCPEYRISEFDMMEILSNLVNNAVEAVMELEKEDRNITVIFDHDKIEVINDYKDLKQERTISDFCQKGYSSKGKGRGYGLPNVIDIAKKNKAEFSIVYEGDLIIASIKFKPPAK